MPFAALTGFGAVINETSRLTAEKHELSEDELRLLNESLNLIIKNIKKRPEITLTRFIPDKTKPGGSYESLTGNVRRVDEISREIIFTDKTVISIEDVLLIETSDEL